MAERILVSDVVEEFLLYLESIKGYSFNTIVSYKNDLCKFVFFTGAKKYIDEVTFNDLRYAIACLTERGEKSSSINRYISAVRTLFAYCRKFSYIKDNPSLKLKTVQNEKPYHKVITDQEMYDICTIPEQKKMLWPTRDKALFEMLYSSGCRVSEICSLKMSSFSADFSKAKITGKGNKDRFVFFEEDAKNALKAYLLERDVVMKKAKAHNFVFVNQTGIPLTTRGVTWILAKYTGVEGINHHFSPHAFRHAFATAMVDAGLDIRKVQALLGHSSVSTTQRYTHVSRAKIEKDYRKAHPHGRAINGEKDE